MENEHIEYDIEEGAKEVAERTGIELSLVEEILEAEFLFEASLGAFEVPDDDEGEEFMDEIRRLREAHSDLIPPFDSNLEEIDDLEDRLVTFVSRITAADPAAIEDVLDEHILYLESKGLLPMGDEDEGGDEE